MGKKIHPAGGSETKVFFMSASNVTQMLLIACKHHHTEILFIYSISVSMTRAKSLMSYLCILFFIFTFIFLIFSHIISLKQTHFFCPFFYNNMSYYFWMITWIKKPSNFPIAKVQPQGVSQPLLDFLPISTWRYL